MSSTTSISASFELGEDIHNEGRRIQDATWSDAIVDARVHFSNREACIVYTSEFLNAIKDYHLVILLYKSLRNSRSSLYFLQSDMLRNIIEFGLPGLGPMVTKLLSPSKKKVHVNNSHKRIHFKVCIRKRPLLYYEVNNGMYDITYIPPNTSGNIVLHDGRMARNGRQLTMTHHSYHFHKVWNEFNTNHRVCIDEIEPLLMRVLDGFHSTLICYGQTGTGKTYTLTGALNYIANRIPGQSIEVSFYELHGKKCYDLLNHRQVLPILSDHNDTVHVRGLKRIFFPELHSPSDLITVLEAALLLRSSEVTERNPISSRSHAICSIRFYTPCTTTTTTSTTSTTSSLSNNLDGDTLASESFSEGVHPSNKENQQDSYTSMNQLEKPEDSGSSSRLSPKGQFMLVDLAGSERNYETTQMTAVQHRESAQINLSLMALKDCFRSFHNDQLNDTPTTKNTASTLSQSDKKSSSSKQHGVNKSKIITPKCTSFRASPLTRILKHCFTKGTDHHTTIIVTISPSPIDLVHTLNSFDHVMLMSPDLCDTADKLTLEVPLRGSALSHKPVHTWTTEQVQAWMGTANAGRFAHLTLPPGLDGRKLMNLNESSLVALSAELGRQARQEGEGEAWVITGENARHENIGRALWSALRRENIAASIRAKNMGTIL